MWVRVYAQEIELEARKSWIRTHAQRTSHTSNHFSNYTFNLNINGMLNHNPTELNFLRAVLPAASFLFWNWIWPQASEKKVFYILCVYIIVVDATASATLLCYKFWIPKLSSSSRSAHLRAFADEAIRIWLSFFSNDGKKCLWFSHLHPYLTAHKCNALDVARTVFVRCAYQKVNAQLK